MGQMIDNVGNRIILGWGDSTKVLGYSVDNII